MNIRFTDEMNPTRAAKVAGVLKGERLLIPTQEDYGSKHDEWVAKAEAELATGGVRFAMLAELNNRPVGAFVWRCAEEPGVVDLRNISIDPGAAGRHFATFMMRNVPYSVRDTHPDAEIIRVDTKTTNTAMLGFLAQEGYRLTEISDLYNSGKPDAILEKTLVG